ncbi:hypothetical protein [Pseudomonas lundensis]|uniref:hypothetical protein n=1 Tax=Pseudomonas lundensis TaxID=86185 RepID=UPI000641F1FD|nr:hypothetical protein [Pseudomonas lundensis]
MDNETDRLHCMAIRHEYFRCKDAFELFVAQGESIVLQGHSHQRAYRAYNAYSSFIHHLYELYMALFARDHQVVDIKSCPRIKAWVKGEQAKGAGDEKSKVGTHTYTDGALNEQVHLQANQWLSSIDRGAVSAKIYPRSQYERMLPVDQDFGPAFRSMRNKIAGHVTYERIELVKLTEFFQKYHPYLCMLFRNVGGSSFGRYLDTVPDFGEVTSFLEIFIQPDPNTKAE